MGRIFVIAFCFSWTASLSSKLRNPILFIPSFVNGRFRRPSKPAPKAGRHRRLRKESCSDEGLAEKLKENAELMRVSFQILSKMPNVFGRPILFDQANFSLRSLKVSELRIC